MSRLLIRLQAEQDLDEIWWRIAQDSQQNADRFLDLIGETCIVIFGYPNIGESAMNYTKDYVAFQ